MKHKPIFRLALLALLLAGCGQQEVPSVDALSADPSRLRLLKEQCRAGQLDGGGETGFQDSFASCAPIWMAAAFIWPCLPTVTS